MMLKHRWNGLDEVYVLIGIVSSTEAAQLGFMAIAGNRYAILGTWDEKKQRTSTHSVEESMLHRCYQEM